MGLEIRVIVAAIVCCGILAGCNTGAPRVLSSSGKGITVSYEPIVYTAEAMALVEDHCRQQGRDAVRTMTNNAPLKTETFECK